MTSTVNDLHKYAAKPPCGRAKTLVELAIYIVVHRSKQPVAEDVFSKMLNGWFGRKIEPADLGATTMIMVRHSWLVPLGDGFRAAAQGRLTTRPLVNEVVRMFDRGTRLLDLAPMMSVLRLMKGELDNAHV